MTDAPPLQWSTSYRLASPGPSSHVGKDLGGDKILLPPSALQELLNLSAADALPHPLMFQLVNPANGITAYAGIREFSADEHEVVLSPHLREALGIRESDRIPSAPPDKDGDSDMPSEMLDAPRIQVRFKQLPRGTYARLRPLEAGYDPDDWRPLLERQLRSHFTTLTRGSTLKIQGAKGEEFHLLVDKFKPDGDGICVVDTDLEVDIEPLDEEQARETLRQIQSKSQRRPGTAAGSSVGGAIDIWKDVEGQVLPGDYVDYELRSWDKARPIVVELAIHDGGDLDLFVSPKSSRQRALPRGEEHVFGDLSSPKDGTKRIVILPTNDELKDAESLLISVHGFALPGQVKTSETPCRFTLRARAAELEEKSSVPDGTSPSATPAADEEQCRNCLQIVPKRTMVLHENFCLRNNVVCPHCKNVLQKRSDEWQNHWHCPSHPDAWGSSAASKAKHEYVEHTLHTCPSCGPSSAFPSLRELAHHRTTLCPHKLILCQFCHLEVPQEGDPSDLAAVAERALTGLTAHELADGARTTDCHLCGAIVRLRDMPAHVAHHELDKASRPRPRICRVELCGRVVNLNSLPGLKGGGNGGRTVIQDPGNDLGLCAMCFAPLFVSMHDPDGRAMRRRIERRYVTQLIKGCGNVWCRNEYCKTGRKTLGLEEKGTSVKEALEMSKPLLEEIGDHGRVMHFCVEERAQRRREMAKMLAAEGVYELEWCVAAFEAEDGDVAQARGWLENWAPTKMAAARTS
ncbi:hypothetical protein VTJ83DRAFT_5317 [Remersonia thermophila]|uniref:Ubiquitin-protein ligase E3A N-terminal zinc-binding domain-containing protein n=1 Tax=Remersonia thermophila TaxID=72144 RepID=A0ABR4D7A7_9PEZI